ncbi:unnamed protein product, partial [Nesidiocoris tenuis]
APHIPHTLAPGIPSPIRSVTFPATPDTLLIMSIPSNVSKLSNGISSFRHPAGIWDDIL